MPQLEFSDFAPQLVWLVITFGLLYFLMARVALPRIATVIEERRDRIANDLAQAEQLRNETEKAIAAYEQALAEARAKAHAIAQQARERLNEELERERAEVEQKIAEKIAQAEAAISKSKKESLAQIEEIAKQTAGVVIERLLGEKLSEKEISGAVSQALGH